MIKVGDTIRLDSDTGAWGIVEYVDEGLGGASIKWCFGVDGKGVPIEDTCWVGIARLVAVDPMLFKRFVKSRAWGDEQHNILDKLVHS